MIFFRKDSRYWWLSLPRDGQKPLRISTKIRVKAATPGQTKENRLLAEAAFDAAMGDLARRRFKLPSAGRSFADQSAWHETHHTAQHRGAHRERGILAKLRAHFGAMALTEIRPARWDEYATTRRAAGVAINTIARELAVLKSVLSRAVGEHLEISPLASVKRQTQKLKAKRTMTRAEERPFLRALRALDLEIHDLYLVGVGTLLRQGNLLELRRGDHRGASLALDTKTGPHQVPLTGPTPLQRRAAAVLARRLPADPAGYFFPIWQARFSAHEQPGYVRATFLRIVRRAAKAAGIPWGLKRDGIVWHTATRATGATRMLREYRIDIRTVQLIGGWRSLDQMAEYLGVGQDAITNIARPARDPRKY